MNSGVKQAGLAHVLPHGAARPGQKKDGADTAFGNIVRSGEKSFRQTSVTSTVGPKWDAAGPRLALASNTVGQSWHPASRVDVGLKEVEEESGDSPDLALETHPSQKPLKNSTELHAPQGAETEPGADDKDGGQSGAMMPPVIAAFVEDRNIKIGSDAQGTDPTSNMAGNVLAAAGDSAGSSFRKATPINDQLHDAAAEGNMAPTDSAMRTEKSGNRAAADSSNFSRQPAPATDPQQKSGLRSDDHTSADTARPIAREATKDARQTEPPGANSKVSVVSTQTLPAPANAAANVTTAAFIDAISAESVWKASASEAVTHLSLHTRPQPGAIQNLKIQLHPAELGMVTADLRFTGEQLSVELKVESAEAYHRLSSDTDTIVKAFRALGYEIDQIAIQQPQPNSQASRTDTGAAGSGGFSRDLQSGFSSNSGGDGTRFGGQGRNTEGGGQDARYNDGSGSISRDRASRGLYI